VKIILLNVKFGMVLSKIFNQPELEEILARNKANGKVANI
jgi:hypothetical protein